MKVLKYDSLGKFKYDVLALFLALALLILGVTLGIVISPWFLIFCLSSPFGALLYESQSLIEFRDTNIKLEDNNIVFLYSNGEKDRISYHELKSIEVDIKKDFAQLYSFPVKIKTHLKEYSFLFCGLDGEANLNQFITSLAGKTTCEFIDKNNIFSID